MRQVLHLLVEFLRDFAWGLNAGCAIRHGAPLPPPRRRRTGPNCRARRGGTAALAG